MLRKSLIALVVAGLLVDSALAGPSVTVTPLGGTIGPKFNNGIMHGFTYSFGPGGGPAGPRNLYDNIPTFLGGTSDPGMFGAFGSIPGTFAFADWKSPIAQYGDDLHSISAGGPGPAVITSIHYFYLNTLGTTTHLIKLLDYQPESGTYGGVIATVVKGTPLTPTIIVPSLPFGDAFSVAVTGLSIPVPRTSVWVKFEEIGFGFPGTYWLTGGTPGVGYSIDGLNYTIKDVYPTYYGGTFTYNFYLPGPFFEPVSGRYLHGNIALGLNGFHIPAPAAISLLGLGGLLTLRRRRALEP